jgi:hypothetical protein
MSYITDSMLRSISDVPVSLPTTRVTANTWLIVATIQLSSGVTATFSDLLLQLVDAIGSDGTVYNLSDTCNPVNIGLVNSNYGLAYIGIVQNLTSSSLDPSQLQFIGTQNDVLTISTQGVVTRPAAAAPLSITAAGTYSFVIVNNCQGTASPTCDLRLLVSGSIRVSST